MDRDEDDRGKQADDRGKRVVEDAGVSMEFICSICVSIMCLPVVLACGHSFCLWCMYKCIAGKERIQCPLCRAKDSHLPKVCEALHCLLQMKYPEEYNKRMEQAHKYILKARQVVITEDVPTTSSSSNFGVGLTGTEFDCKACEMILFRPVILKCGHACCEACWNRRCPVCGIEHPKRIIKVCLVLHHLLEEHFGRAYSRRTSSLLIDFPSLSAYGLLGLPPHVDPTVRWSINSFMFLPKIHHGIGCDNCGIYPIVGTRYECMSCKVYDLCNDCYWNCATFRGRFNQNHNRDHGLLPSSSR